MCRAIAPPERSEDSRLNRRTVAARVSHEENEERHCSIEESCRRQEP